MSNKVCICGVDTSKLPKAKPVEMNKMIKEIKNGSCSARKTFIIYNMRLVLSIVQRFSIKRDITDDVFQVGMIGLLKAVDNFNPEIGVQFSTYAVPMIIGEIKRYLRDNNSIKVTRGLRDIAYQALKIKEELLHNNSSENPSIEEIAKRLNLPEYEISIALDSINEPISLFETAYNDEDGGILVLDQIKDKDVNEDSWIEATELKIAISKLENREKEILILRYYHGKTQMEVSQEVGISQAQVSMLEKNALSELMESM